MARDIREKIFRLGNKGSFNFSSKSQGNVEGVPEYVPVHKPKVKKDVFVDSLELPSNYNATRLTLMARDPFWIHAYWEISSSSLQSLRQKIGDEFDRCAYVLRMYDVTLVNFNDNNANHWFDIDVGPHSQAWYVNLWSDNVTYCADLGLRTPDGRFFTLARSNFVTTPRANLSDRSDMIWMEVNDGQREQPHVLVEKMRDQKRKEAPSGAKSKTLDWRARRRMYLSEDDIRSYYTRLFPLLRLIKSAKGISELGNKLIEDDVALRDGSRERENQMRIESSRNAALQNAWVQSRFLKKVLAGASEESVTGGSEVFQESSRGGASEREQRKRKFFFEIWADLIVYGRTEPDATVCLGDKKVKLREDGTFTLRYSLPDGKIPFDFVAQSFDKLEKKNISTSVERTKTMYGP
ncbi:MAG: DUF4912 domain-containing protein [Candidatus Omnitrophota bacterium]